MNFHIESGSAALASAASATGAAMALPLNIGLPLPELMAAFAGAALILSFLSPQKDSDSNLLNRRRQVGTIVFCTLAGMWAGPFAAKWLSIEHGSFAALGVTFALAALGQVTIPALIAKREAIADWAMSLLPRRGG